LIPLLDGGKDMPKLYDGYFNSQIAKQAATAVGAALARGKTNIEVQLPPVPNLEEVRFGCVQWTTLLSLLLLDSEDPSCRRRVHVNTDWQNRCIRRNKTNRSVLFFSPHVMVTEHR
jgi:hypothetical protein